MILTALDLELNQPSGKIIQIGAVAGNTLTGEIVGRLRVYVDPNEPINPYITDLCNITQDQINKDGIDLDSAYEKLKSFHHRHSTFINPVTWGGDDANMLKEQLSSVARENWVFGRRHIDAKTLVVTQNIAKNDKVLSGGLSTAMKNLGLKFVGQKHDAQDDAENTFKIYHHLLYLIKHGSF